MFREVNGKNIEVYTYSRKFDTFEQMDQWIDNHTEIPLSWDNRILQLEVEVSEKELGLLEKEEGWDKFEDVPEITGFYGEDWD